MLLPLSFFSFVFFLIVYLILSVVIVLELKKYGEKASIWLMQVRIFTYVSKYKDVMMKRYGSATLHTVFWFCYVMAIFSFLLMFFTLMAGG